MSCPPSSRELRRHFAEWPLLFSPGFITTTLGFVSTTRSDGIFQHQVHFRSMTTRSNESTLMIERDDAVAPVSTATVSRIEEEGKQASHRFRRRRRLLPPTSESYRYNYQKQGDDDGDMDEDCYYNETGFDSDLGGNPDQVELATSHHGQMRENKHLHRSTAVGKKKKASKTLKKNAVAFSNPLEGHRLLTSSSTAVATISAVAARRHWDANARPEEIINDSSPTTASIAVAADAVDDDDSLLSSSQRGLSPLIEQQHSKTVIPNPLYQPSPLSASKTHASLISSSLRSRRSRASSVIVTPQINSASPLYTNKSSSLFIKQQATNQENEEAIAPIVPTTTIADGQNGVAIEVAPAGNGLRPSLDAGMAAVRRWIQSKTTVSSASTTNTRTSSNVIANSPDRSIASRSAVPGLSNEDDEEDWLSCVDHHDEDEDSDDDNDDDNDLRSRLLRDLQDQAHSLASDSNITFDSSPIRKRSSRRLEVVDQWNVNAHHNQRRLNDAKSSSANEAANHYRQRALSEPNGLLLRDDIFQRAVQGGFRRRSQRSRSAVVHSDHIPYRDSFGQSRQLWTGNCQSISSPSTILRSSNRSSNSNRPISNQEVPCIFHNTATIAAIPQRSAFFSNNLDAYVTSATAKGAASRTFEMTSMVSSNTRSSSASALVEPPGSDQASFMTRDEVAVTTAAATTTTQLLSSTQPQPALSSGATAEGSSEQESPPAEPAEDPDPNRASRLRWIRINRRFQLIITVVALIFSLLLFGILVCWVVLTSAYVVSIDKICDVPLKPYFWLVTLQLILDVFRSDIMRVVCRWDANSRERIPCRVISYNILYLTYALLVLRLGIRSVFARHGGMCRHTAPELYQSSAAFVTLSIAAWSTIVLGYLVPFCFVATLLTWNGYTPASDADRQTRMGGGFGGVFPSTSGAPPGCIDQMRIVRLEEFPQEFTRECCICIGDFAAGDIIVATRCNHVFHKQCCREWLRQARTCPVCRSDIPTSLSVASENEQDLNNNTSDTDNSETASQPPPSLSNDPGANRLGRPFSREGLRHEVVGLLRFLRQHEDRVRFQQRQRSQTNSQPQLSSDNPASGNVISASGLTPGEEVGGRLRSELPMAPSSAPTSTSRHVVSLVPTSQSVSDLASMEEGRSSNNNHHQHSM